jgi:hypothetical protein
VTATPRTRTTSGLGPLERIDPPATVPYGDCYRSRKGCTIIVAQEPALRAPAGIWLPPAALLLWHLSIAHRRRYPTWDEIADARYELVPGDVTMAMLLPPPDEYVNANEHCFHLWQIEDRRAG